MACGLACRGAGARQRQCSIGSHVRLLLGSLFTFAAAALIGLGATWLALNEGIAYGGITIGAWTAWPKNGTPGIDPYARAMVARSGELPVGSGDGVTFYARADDAARPLDGPCDLPRARTPPPPPLCAPPPCPPG